MSEIKIGASLVMEGVNTPTRKGEIVSRLEEIYNITTPYVGMKVWCGGKAYIVTELESSEIAGIVVPNSKVKSFEALVFNSELAEAEGNINSILEKLGAVATIRFGEVVDNVNVATSKTDAVSRVDYYVTGKCFVARNSHGKYYAEWDGMEEYMQDGRPYADKVYLSANSFYMWNGETLAIDKEITNEIARAQAAEQQLQGNISAEVSRAQAAEEELRGLINTGGGVYLGSFDDASDFNNRLNTLTYDPAVTGKNIGFFRAKVSYRDVEVKNILLSSGLNVIVQVVAGTFVSVNNTLTLTDSGYNVFTRKHENGAWSEWLKWNGAIEGGSGGNVSDEQLEAIYAAINAEKARAEEVENSLQAQIMAINLGAKVTISLSPSVVYKETSTSVVITANMSGVTPATLKLTDANGSELGSVSNKSSVSATKTYSLSADMKFNAVAEYSGAQFKGSGTLYARYPIYAGFGVSASAVAVDANKKSARTSAAGTYSATLSNATGTQHYYILVPSDINALSSFSMGGAPFVMNSSVETINGISYKVYKSGGAYGNGASVNIVAS